ncbi:type II toxin-antitoxin system VapC family toxin [Microbacterium sp.]|uniref:type II toxin-antitoxin system VapC family toxin n=1 Tax=Microbacterium sp. TaxID=51671 RepID=UPI003A8D3933
MIVDSSAIVAVLLREPEAPVIERMMVEIPCFMSAATLVEVRAVIGGRTGVDGLRDLAALLRRFAVDVVPFDERQADVAGDAYRDYGRGSGHAAQLNLGDTFSYALASVRDEPLLYVGDDFSHTDIRSALPPTPAAP